MYPNGPKTAVIMICLYISMFLVALDRTILATAIPSISNEFNSIDVRTFVSHARFEWNANFGVGYRMVW